MRKIYMLLAGCFLSATMVIGGPGSAQAKVEWDLRNISIECAPVNITVSRDGKTVYILCEKSLLIYDNQKEQVTEKIPLERVFSDIALSGSEEDLLLTDGSTKQITIIGISRIYDIPAGRSPIIGSPKAAVRVTAFMDYQCPYCSRAFPLLEHLLKKYPEDVNLVIKHYPLRMHRFAVKASLAALAAEKQGKYAGMTRAMVQNFKQLSDEKVESIAISLGLDMHKFNEAMEDASLNEILAADAAASRDCDVRGVPAIFVNGRRADRWSLQDLCEMVAVELKKNRP